MIIEVPNPKLYPELFNDFIKQNNKVVSDHVNWILIKNKFIKKQLVLFCKNNRKYLSDCSKEELIELTEITAKYKDNHMYINWSYEKSIPDRLHLHIKL